MKKIFSILLSLIMCISSFAVISFAEEKVLTKTSSWEITASTEMGAAFSVEKAFDGDESTLWHSHYTVVDGGAVPSEIPSSITVDFGKEETVSGFTYVRRKDNPSGLFTSFEVFASNDGSNFTSIYKGTFDFGADRSDMSDKTASWGNKKMRAIRILFTGRGVATAAEIKFLTDGATDGKSEVTDKPAVVEKPAVSTGESNILAKTSSWKIEASTSVGSAFSVEKAFDGDDATLWHSHYTVVDGGAVPSEIPSSITVDFGKEETVSGFTYVRRKDNPSGLFTSFEVFASNDGSNFTSIYKGTFDFGADRSDMSDKTASWGNKKMRAIRILFTGRGVATAAEIKFLTDTESVTVEQASSLKKASNGVTTIDRENWDITTNSEIASVPITNVLDGDLGSFWHSYYKATGGSVTYKDDPPFIIEIDLKKKEKISGLILTPRDSKAGIITKFDLFASVDGGEYNKLLEGKTLLDTTDEKEILFRSNVEADKIKIVVTEGTSKYGTLAELNLVGENKEFKTISFEEFFAEDSPERMVAIDKTDITVSCDAPFWANFKPGNIIDGNTNTFWQTEAGSDFVLTIDFGKVEKFGRIEYIPRNTADFHGFWLDFDIMVSIDGVNWDSAGNYKLDKKLGVNNIELGKEVEARYVEIYFNEVVERRVSCAELTFYQTIASKKEVAERNKESYTLTIGSNVINVYKNGESYDKTIDVAPYIVNGSTLIPLRGLMEEMGATIDWVGHNQMIQIDNGVYYIELQIWNNIVYVESQAYGRVRYSLLNFPVIKDSRTFIPVRFVSEMLGYSVEWVAEKQQIIITK